MPTARSVASLLLSLLLSPLLLADVNGIQIQKAQLERRADQGLISADIDYHLPDVALKALDEGIPLSFRFVFTIARLLPLGLRWTLHEEERNIQIRHLPLAQSYQVKDLGSGAVQSFTSLSQVMETLAHIRNWVIDLSTIPSDQPAEASLAFRFDIEALPLPLRIQAYVAPEWHMQNRPYRWQIPP